MRARNIKPGFFANDQLAECDPLARILFTGLWCLADREGRLEDRPRKIKMQVLAYDTCDVEVLLSELAREKLILRYEVDGQRLIQVVNFTKHQNPHYKEPPSDLPAPPGWIDSGYVVGGVTEAKRQEIFDRDGRACLECGSTDDLSLDHIIPRSKGGTNDDDNLRTLCRRCNSAKNNRLAKAEHEASSANDRSSIGQSSDDRSPANPADSLIPDSLIPDSLIPDTGLLEDGASAPEPPRPSEIALEVAESLITAPWVNDDLIDVAREVDRLFGKVPDYNVRDGPAMAELYANWRGYRKKPPENWSMAWLKWLRKEVGDGQRSETNAATRDNHRPGRYSSPEAEQPITSEYRPRQPRAAV